MMEIKRGSVAWRILLEIAGRDEPMKLHELCSELEIEPSAARDVVRTLYLDDRLAWKRDSQCAPTEDDGWYLITWQGQDALQRIADQADAKVRKGHWWNRR
jgi:predicted transcriptional regulator